MASCEKCWGDAYTRSRITGRDQATCYAELIKERGDHPCTPEEQAGSEGKICPACGRKTINPFTGWCTNCDYKEI